MSIAKVVFRLLSLVGKEIVETVRRPGSALSLILGPFVILALFGFGYDSVRDPFRAMVVTARLGSAAGHGDVGSARHRRRRRRRRRRLRAEGRAALDAGRADLLVSPGRRDRDLRIGSAVGHQGRVRDRRPDSRATPVAAREVPNEVNRQSSPAVAEGQPTPSTTRDRRRAVDIPGDRMPTRRGRQPEPHRAWGRAAHGPAAIALILQHMALTLVAMSLVKEGVRSHRAAQDLSVTTTELIIGKVLSFGARRSSPF
jgi:ABC-2 type transport system permease protein